jgi:sulfatase maturation enzyme AslB (radical SAM superfamily)
MQPTSDPQPLSWSLAELQAEPAALTVLHQLPTQAAVGLHLPGLTDDVLRDTAPGLTRAHARRAVTIVAAHGRPVQLEVQLVGPSHSGVQLVQALFELCRLDLRFPGQLQITAPPPASPADPWVAHAFAGPLLDPAHHHTHTLVKLRASWLERWNQLPEGEERRAGELLLRWLDDAPRRLLFEMLEQSWLRTAPDWPGGALDKPVAMAITERTLGETGKWLKAFRQHTYQAVRRLVIIPTWQCELRCSYCWIPKQDGREMPLSTIERSVELLLATERPEVWLQFFGGEALIEYERVQHAIRYSSQRAHELGKQISYVISSNGWTLDEAKLAWLKQYPVHLELSLDGDERTQTRYRPSRWKGESSYEHSIATRAKQILESGIDQYVIMVVHPTNVTNLPANFFHLADLGFRHIQINNMLGRIWKPHELEQWAQALFAIGRELQRRWAAGEELEFINMRHRPMAMRLNGEVTVDHDGKIYGGNSFLHETEHKSLFEVGHLDQCTHIDRYWIDATDNNFLLDWSYRAKITANNVEVGKVMASFCKWMRSKGYGPTGPSTPALPAARPEPSPGLLLP